MEHRLEKHRGCSLCLAGKICIGILLGIGLPAYSGVKVYSVEQSYGPYRLASETLQQMPGGLVPVRFEEAVWVLGYSTEVLSAEGEALSTDLHCHTVISSSIAGGHPRTGEPFRGLFSDGFTQRVQLPRGYGLYYEAEEEISVIPMFNNRSNSMLDASMKIKLDFVRAEELPQPLTPLYSTVVSVATNPDMYFVPPGPDVRELEFSLPYSGTIQAMGVHIHPYGRSIELINQNTGETVWKAIGSYGDDGRLIEMPFFSTSAGYPFGPEDRFLLRATYQNPTDIEQDAMAGLFIFFSTEDGKQPSFDTAAAAAVQEDTTRSGAHGGH